MSINAHSVRKPNAVFHLSTDLAAQSIDWCFVTESCLNSDIDDIFISIPNYNLFRCDRSAKNSKKTMEVGMFLCSEQFLMYPDIPSRQEQFEVLWLEIDIMSPCALICFVFYPPLCDYDKDLCAFLNQAYDHLCLAKNYWQFILCGDFNDFRTDDVTAECNLLQINFEPTHNNKVLDKILVSCPWNIPTVQTVNPTVSTDHDSVLCFLQTPKNGKKVFFFRDQRESCRQICYKLLRDAKYNCVYRSMDPNKALCQLNSIMCSAVHISCPTRQVTVRDRDPIYVNLAVKLLIKQQNKQLRKQNAAKVKVLNKRIQKLVRKNCRIFDKVGSRNWWTHINSLSKDKQPASPVNVDVNNLNWYLNSFSNDPNGQPQLEKIEFLTGKIPCFYPRDIYHYLKKQKQTSQESSGLPFWILTYAAETLAEPICLLFNLILLSRTVPDFFKISNIRPIPKVARATLPNHFRPIAVTPILSRLFERMLYDKYIKKPYNTYICSKQFGFRQNSSTCSALINLLHDVCSLRKNYNYIRLITLDMSKAFDTFQHSKIFREISRCVPPLNEYVVDVLKCFLTSRSHYTSLGSRFSPPASINHGVPLGTIAGPFFFNYAVNDTFRCEFLMSPSTRITVYADDNTPLIGSTYTGGDNALDIIHKFGDHFCSKNLYFNADKSSKRLLNFGRHDVPLISGINRKSSVKLLGILFDEKLSFIDHVKMHHKTSHYQVIRCFSVKANWVLYS